MRSTDLKLILVDPILELYEQWQLKFEGQPRVEVVNGRFEDLPNYPSPTSILGTYTHHAGADVDCHHR